MPERISGKEIAKELGVSPTTISLVRKGKAGVSQKTRRRIIDYMLQHGYSEAEVGSPRQKTVALLFRDDLFDLKQLFYNEIIAYILQYSRDLPYNILVRSVNYENKAQDDSFIPENCEWDAAVICSDPDDAILCQLYQHNIPFIVLDSSVESSLSCSVTVDYEDAAKKMTEHLIKKGHRTIAYISNSRSMSERGFTVQAFNGFQTALLERGLSVNTQMVRFNAFNEQELHSFLDSVCTAVNRPTAIFCSTDSNAIISMRYLREKGFRVPEDFSVAGMDDINVSRYTTPALTTMRVDRDEMVRKCLELLQSLLSGRHPQSSRISPCKLIERDSVAKI